mmetsp:Transcript_40560/g.81278  ORF Transcript_40560/g.81278 Transcript_40560/m.81278 type:complete len:152 (+) Transcript_40560:181-636(+)
MPTCPAVKERYEGPVTVVGKDTQCEVGMRVRMNEGLTSHGVGTVTECFKDEDLQGCCAVIWDSDQCHTRPLHSHMGNLHCCRVGKDCVYDLVLADAKVCSDFEVVKHSVVERGSLRAHYEVKRECDDEEDKENAESQENVETGGVNAAEER